jgi:ribonuclease P/MRP protein subunit POP5
MVRIKSRWLLIRIKYVDDDQHKADVGGAERSDVPLQLQLLRAIRDSLQHSFGDVGAGAIGGSLAVRYYSPTTRNAIVRCSRQGLPYVWAAVTFCTSFAGRRVRMVVSHCGGTIRKVQQAAIRADRCEIERLCGLRKRLTNRSYLAFRSQDDLLSDRAAAKILDEQAITEIKNSQQLINSIEM